MLVNKYKTLKNKRNKGITLIEVIVTMAILGILSLSLMIITINSTNIFSSQRKITDAYAVRDLVYEAVKGKIKFCTKAELNFNFKNEDNPKFNPVNLIKMEDFHCLFVKNNKIYIAEQNKDSMVDGVVIKPLLSEEKYNGYKISLKFNALQNGYNEKHNTSLLTMHIVITNDKGEIKCDSTSSIRLGEIELRQDSIFIPENLKNNKDFDLLYFL